MKKLQLAIALAALLAAPTMMAAYQVELYRDTSNYSGPSGGGEFKAVPSGGLEWVLPGYDSKVGDASSFQTFCVETSEFVSLGTLYDVAINTDAVKGSAPISDPVSIGTAWLYWQFATGVLAGYDYTAGAARVADADLLQKTIWGLEDEPGYGDPGGKFSAAVAGKFGSWDAAKANNSGAYGVWAMNLTEPSTGKLKQDMLVIPEASTYLAGFGALAMMLVFGWRIHGRKDEIL